MYKDYKDAIPSKDEWQFTETNVQTTIFMMAKKDELTEATDSLENAIDNLDETINEFEKRVKEKLRLHELEMKKLKRVAAIIWFVSMVIVAISALVYLN